MIARHGFFECPLMNLLTFADPKQQELVRELVNSHARVIAQTPASFLTSVSPQRSFLVLVVQWWKMLGPVCVLFPTSTKRRELLSW